MYPLRSAADISQAIVGRHADRVAGSTIDSFRWLDRQAETAGVPDQNLPESLDVAHAFAKSSSGEHYDTIFARSQSGSLLVAGRVLVADRYGISCGRIAVLE